MSWRELLLPTAASVGDRIARLLGGTESASTRLHRTHASMDGAAFRVRQVTTSVVMLCISGALAAMFDVGPVASLLLVAGSALATFAFIEYSLARQSAEWQRRVAAELPVVAEQLGMLLASGYSLGTALSRIGARGRGSCARDLTRVSARVRQGLTETQALQEWAATLRSLPVDRLVAVLVLNRETTELGRLISEEARAQRRDAHRLLIEVLDRRAQQVWIPVTVAALVPGVILLAIPFTQALRLFTAP
jgi:Flp pilus assembly protein TadB